MTDNIKPTAQEKPAWAKIPQEFHDWWNSDYSDESNPFRINSAAYWAWAGWSEAVRLNAQAVPDIDYEALIAAAYRRDRKWAQGTNGCIAFARGAEWFREQCLSAAPAAPQPAQLLDDESDALTIAYLHGHGKGKDSVQPLLAEKDALLRQALEALENGARVRNAEGGTKYQPPIEEAAIEAIRNHLGVKND